MNISTKKTLSLAAVALVLVSAFAYAAVPTSQQLDSTEDVAAVTGAGNYSVDPGVPAPDPNTTSDSTFNGSAADYASAADVEEDRVTELYDRNAINRTWRDYLRQSARERALLYLNRTDRVNQTLSGLKNAYRSGMFNATWETQTRMLTRWNATVDAAQSIWQAAGTRTNYSRQTAIRVGLSNGTYATAATITDWNGSFTTSLGAKGRGVSTVSGYLGSNSSTHTWKLHLPTNPATNADPTTPVSGTSVEVENLTVVAGSSSTPLLQAEEYAAALHGLVSTADAVDDADAAWRDDALDRYPNVSINMSDVVAPQIPDGGLSRTADPAAWTLRQALALGLQPPASVDSIASMTVTTASGATHEGILLAAGNPPAQDGYVLDQTYDPADISSPVLVVTDSGPVELTDEFSVSSVTMSDGTAFGGSALDYSTVTRDRETLAGWQQTNSEMRTMLARIEAHGGTMGGLAGFVSGRDYGGATTAVVVGGVVLLAGGLLYTRRDEW